MAINDLKLILDVPEYIFYSGEIVTGKVHIDLEEAVTVNREYPFSLLIVLKGYAKTHWQACKRNYKGYEEYCYKAVALVQPKKPMRLEAGNRTCAFRIDIPVNIPTSHEGTYGKICYKIKAKLKLINDNIVHQAKDFLDVISPIDLFARIDPKMQKPFYVEESKYFCCLWCLTGPIYLSTIVPRRGFQPGDYMVIAVEMRNGSSSTTIECLKFQLIQTTTYYTTSRMSRKEEVTIVGEESVQIRLDDHGVGSIWASSFNLPKNLPPTFSHKLKIIDVNYYLKVKAVPVDPLRSIENVIPIIIGARKLKRSKKPGYHYVQCLEKEKKQEEKREVKEQVEKEEKQEETEEKEDVNDKDVQKEKPEVKEVNQ